MIEKIPKPKQKINCSSCGHGKNKPSGGFCNKFFLYTAELNLPRCPYYKPNATRSKQGKLLKDVCRNWEQGWCRHYNIKLAVNHKICKNFRDKGKRGCI